MPPGSTACRRSSPISARTAARAPKAARPRPMPPSNRGAERPRRSSDGWSAVAAARYFHMSRKTESEHAVAAGAGCMGGKNGLPIAVIGGGPVGLAAPPRSMLKERGWQEPPPGALPTGRELYDAYLAPLADALAAANGTIAITARVRSISRRGID